MIDLKLYKSCNTLPIARFFRIFETDDLRHLIINFDYENDTTKLTGKERRELSDIFEDIYYEYNDITNNFKYKTILKKQILIAQWTFTYEIISNLINLYSESKDIECLRSINTFNDISYTFDFSKPLDKQVKSVVVKMKGLKNKIKIFKSKLAESVKTDKKQTKIDLDLDALYLEKNLELKRSIDPETTSVSKWVKMIQINKQKQKEDATIRNRRSKG